MNATVTPPPAAPAASSPAPAPHRRGPGKPVAIVLGVIGAIVLLGFGFDAVRSTVSATTRVSDVQTASADGLASLDVRAEASSFTIEFGDVADATLEVSDARGEWTLDRSGDELVVASRDGWFGGGRGWWNWGDDEERVVLTLPEVLRDAGLDADLELAAGRLEAEGAFGSLVLDVGAGGMEISGSAETLEVDLSAGDARFDLADVSRADLSVSAGRLQGELTGAAPDTVGVVVSAGSVDLTLPAASYEVRSEVSAGSFDSGLEESPSSRHQVDVDVSAGHVVLRDAG
ncbi:hypothetical protein [Microbacterium marinilacus]|uniref:Adhesin domain-containing protein n=1 Tax=Microbacterium marinilacus TaxID=415209 RepID=A0ABP7BE20_9MICO|nr:hypothetical protein [Microbacterium marinilacus]MBY0689372.1 hypothetical protein [Microbacterium marinilacus]